MIRNIVTTGAALENGVCTIRESLGIVAIDSAIAVMIEGITKFNTLIGGNTIIYPQRVIRTMDVIRGTFIDYCDSLIEKGTSAAYEEYNSIMEDGVIFKQFYIDTNRVVDIRADSRY